LIGQSTTKPFLKKTTYNQSIPLDISHRKEKEK